VRRVVRRDSPEAGEQREAVRIGARVMAAARGRVRRGTVHYADELQILVKWDDGSSSSLRVGSDPFRIVNSEQGEQAPS
jgi:hypothetical protein